MFVISFFNAACVIIITENWIKCNFLGMALFVSTFKSAWTIVGLNLVRGFRVGDFWKSLGLQSFRESSDWLLHFYINFWEHCGWKMRYDRSKLFSNKWWSISCTFINLGCVTLHILSIYDQKPAYLYIFWFLRLSNYLRGLSILNFWQEKI